MSKKLIKKRILKGLEKLYSSLPHLECKGLCQEACGPIAMTETEFRRISDKSGTVPSVDEHGTCSLLVDGKCSVYEVRPAVCRLFGAVPAMTCPFGCIPTPRFMTRDEELRFFDQIDELTGNKPMRATIPELERVLHVSRKR
jgi:uncharacterized protein